MTTEEGRYADTIANCLRELKWHSMADHVASLADGNDMLMAENERHRRANLLRAIQRGYGRDEEWINEVVNDPDFQAIPWRLVEHFQSVLDKVFAAETWDEIKALQALHSGDVQGGHDGS